MQLATTLRNNITVHGDIYSVEYNLQKRYSKEGDRFEGYEAIAETIGGIDIERFDERFIDDVESACMEYELDNDSEND
jgi:hypothetical protein